MRELLKDITPERVKKFIRSYQQQQLKKAVEALPKLSGSDFEKIIKDDLGLQKGDVVFIHSSIDHINLDFSFFNIIPMLLDAVGESGTVLFPTYPKLTSYKFLKSGQIFDVRKTPSFTGLLNEFARRYKGAVRSLHPTKSCVAIGKYARELTDTHQKSPYPYDSCSPYYKIMNYDGKIAGLGVDSTFISFVHCIDDSLKEKFPVKVYYDELFQAQCRNYQGETVIVPTYAHDMHKMEFDLPSFLKKYVPNEVVRNVSYYGTKFYQAYSKPLYEIIHGLAEQGITFYPKRLYK